MLFQIAYEGVFRSLCAVTFWQKVNFLISQKRQDSRLYGNQWSVFGALSISITFLFSGFTNPLESLDATLIDRSYFSFWTPIDQTNVAVFENIAGFIANWSVFKYLPHQIICFRLEKINTVVEFQELDSCLFQWYPKAWSQLKRVQVMICLHFF